MILDICLVLPLAWGMFKGFKRGLIIELCTLMALALGVYGAAKLGDWGGEYVHNSFNTDPTLSRVLGFALVFLLIVIAVYFFGKALEKVVKLVALGIFNKLAGLLFGAAKYALVLSAILFLIERFPFTESLLSPDQKSNSYLYEPISGILPVLYPVVTDSGWIDQIENTFEEIKEELQINQE